MGRYFVYILTNDRHTVLYTGVTNNLLRRIDEHRAGMRSFTGRYNVHKLVYFEEFREIDDAIAREKQIKGGSRRKKVALIDESRLARIGGRSALGPACHCERREAISDRVRTRLEVASSLRSSQ